MTQTRRLGVGSLGVATLALALACAESPRPVPAPAVLPALPTLVLDGMGEEARERLAAAHDEAVDRPNAADASGRLGMLLQAYRQYRSAERCYERAHLLAPQELRWAYYLGTVRFLLGLDSEATGSLRAAVRLDQDYVPAQLALADALLASGAAGESEARYQRIADRQPDLALAHFGLGRVQSARGDPAAAIAHYRRACALSESFANAQYALALSYRDVGDTERFQAHLALHQKHLGTEPPLDDPLLAEVVALGASESVRRLRLAIGHMGAGRDDEAVAGFERALEADPTLVDARVHLVNLLGRRGEADRGAEHYRAAVAIDPDRPDRHYNYGVLLRNVERPDEAVAAFERTVALDPTHAEARANLGLVRERQGRIDEAVAHYEAALTQDPSVRMVRLQLGWILLSRGRGREAAEQFRQMTRLEDAETASYLFRAAMAYGRAGQASEAIDYARRARARASSLGQTELVAAIDETFGGDAPR